MEKVVKDWNAPGVGVGIVVKDKLVFAKGYGYRDYEKKLPFTPQTRLPIDGNTTLFTAVAAGMLVEEGKLTWDKPVRDSVPAIRFHNDFLNDNVTLRDMLAHRTGIADRNTIWYKSDLTRKELFERLHYLEPKEPLRQAFVWCSMMYAAAGYLIELQSGKTWEEFVRDRILRPLDMNATVYSVADMLKTDDYGAPFGAEPSSMEFRRVPYFELNAGVVPAFGIISNIQDMSHWVIALMNDGKYGDKQVIPADVLKATLEPAMAFPNGEEEPPGFWDLQNRAYGMGRNTASYRGHLLTFEGWGALPDFYSHVAILPRERIGVIVFLIGNHWRHLIEPIRYNVCERLLGLDQTPWSDLNLKEITKYWKAVLEAQAKAGADRVPDTRASHPLADFAGEYEHPAYGVLRIVMKDGQLQFNFHHIQLPLSRFHYDRFDTPDDENEGLWSVNFLTNPDGEVGKAVMSLDGDDVTFTRRPVAVDPKLVQQFAGTYEDPAVDKYQVVGKEDGNLYLVHPGARDKKLIPNRGFKFHCQEMPDQVFEFVVENGQVKALKQRDSFGEFVYPRK